MRTIHIAIAGGSGAWAEKNHYAAILALKEEGIKVKVVTICDPTNPHATEKSEKRDKLRTVLRLDQPLWVDPTNKTNPELARELLDIHRNLRIDLLVIATNPVHHYFYSYFGLINKINILCDKPLVNNKNSSFDTQSAVEIYPMYAILAKKYKELRNEDSNYFFCSPLKRRTLEPYAKMRNGLAELYQKTGEGIRYMTVLINGGIHKYPQEYLKGGAHGHLDGIGTLSHSAYHYIDIIAWYLKAAPGNIRRIEVQAPYVLRVRDYLAAKTYDRLRGLIETSPEQFDDSLALPSEALDSELDSAFLLKLFDTHNAQVGLITFIVNYSTYTPRLARFDPDRTEYAHDIQGGRMTSVYIDTHQGALQEWQLLKNHEARFNETIELRRKLHPALGEPSTIWKYEHPYGEGTVTPVQLFAILVKQIAGLSVSYRDLELLSNIDDQDLTNKLFSKCYEKLAEEFESHSRIKSRPSIDSSINLRDFC